MPAYHIFPRRVHGRWFFDDPARNIFNEELVYGMDTILDVLCAGKRRLSQGIGITFSDEPLPDALQLDWVHKELAGAGGDWYRAATINVVGWCCPTLEAYFPAAPKTLYLKLSDAGSSGCPPPSRRPTRE